MRISVRPLRPWRMISWQAAWGMRWVKPSSAIVSPSRTASLMASARDEIRAMRGCFPVAAPYLRLVTGRVKWRNRRKFELQRMAAMLGKEPIFTIHADLADIMNFGRTPYGERRVIGILGGSARGTIETDAGARILVSSDGLRHGPPDVMARLARGDSVDPSHYYFRTVMRFETADPAVDWLNRILGLTRGQREANAVRLDVYEVK